MTNVKYLIIGGGVAGTTAAETVREEDKISGVAIISNEPHRLYSRIMLSKPNFFLGKIPFERVWLKTKEWYAQRNIELLTDKKAVLLDAKNKIVTLNDGLQIAYEKLLLAVGGCARKLSIPGADKRGIFYLRTLDDAKAIIVAAKTARQAVCVGGGFVSFEMCEMLRLAGLEVTLLIRENRYWESLLDEISSRIIENAMEKGGVKIIRGAEIKELGGQEIIEDVSAFCPKENNQTKTSCELLIAGIGVFCPHDWIKQAGLEVNRGICANEYLETNISDIWTAGDCAEFYDVILDEIIQAGNWINAQTQGRAAGLNMLGKKEKFKLVSFYSSGAFGITIVFVGDIRPLADRQIIAAGPTNSNSYRRLILKNNRIVGAALINRGAELAAIFKLIENKSDIGGREKELSDANFNLII